jgi:hypothetical protein
LKFAVCAWLEAFLLGVRGGLCQGLGGHEASGIDAGPKEQRQIKKDKKAIDKVEHMFYNKDGAG